MTGWHGLADFGGARAFQPCQVARRFDHRHVQAVADAEERHFALAGEFDGLDLAFGAAFAESTGHQNAMHIFQKRSGIIALEHFAVDPVHVHAHIVGEAAMGQRLGQRLVAVLDLHVFADHGDAHFAFGILHPLDHLLPAERSGARRVLDAEDVE